MGNQLTGMAPSQILHVEHYLADLPDYEYDKSLGSTRFFKVARAKHKEGLAVVKVFVIHDVSLPLESYRKQVEVMKGRLQGATNCLPYQKAVIMDKAAMLYRQYVHHNIYDRISTRPFLCAIEKKWITFQLLCALDQAHKLNVCHGDIKSENVMVTSWSWVLLTDFASYKPTYLPEDNPADFSYFFDTSRRRTSYIAPERFVENTLKKAESQEQGGNIDLTSSEIKKGDLTPAMDIFSAGCVIAELYSEGVAPFDLSQLLRYRVDDYSPNAFLDKIEDEGIRQLIKHMLQKDPNDRLSAEDYLKQEKGKTFPDYFYSFLRPYLQRFASVPILPPDERITRIKRDWSLILRNISFNENDPEQNTILVTLSSLVTSNSRNLQFCNSKLVALDLLLCLSKYVTADIILERMVPFLLNLVNDPFPQVRAEAIRTITQCLANVKEVPISDINIFPEYILPDMSHLTQDPVVLVRIAYAENIAVLAKTAEKFMTIVQSQKSVTGHEGQDSEDETQYKASYDNELQLLHEMIQQKVVTLLSDSDNIVKATLLEKGITQLCVFFGRPKANDVLLSHMITFLNDKHDWHLRQAFFDSIVGVATYVGWQSSTILKPLLQQGLSDSEEFVIHKTLNTLTSLVELGLLQKPIIHELLNEVVPFFCHPGVWIRQGAVGFVSAVARSLNVADVHCNLLPLIQPYLKHSVIQVDKEVVLLNALEESIPRSIYDYILRSSVVERLFDCLQERQLIRNISRPGHKPNYGELDDNLSPTFRKLMSQGMSEMHEDKLLAMQEFMLKLSRTKTSSTDSSNSTEEDFGRKDGVLDMKMLAGKPIMRRHADLYKPGDAKQEGAQTSVKRPAKKKLSSQDSPTVSMNEDWKQMFGSSDSDKLSTHGTQKMRPPAGIERAGTPPAGCPGSQASGPPMVQSGLHSIQLNPDIKKVMPVSLTPAQEQKPVIQTKISPCKMELRHLVYKKREQYMSDQMTKDLLDSAAWENRPPPANWKPKGQLVAHLHEHRAAVNRIQVSPDHTSFATCSNDGTVKIWDCSRMEGKSVTNRSRHTYNKQSGQTRVIAFCENGSSIASANDRGSIHVFRIEKDNPRISILHTKNLDVAEEGLIVDMTHFDTGSQSVIAYATVNGLLVGWDLRTNSVAWQLRNDPKHGLITSFDVHPMQSWLVVGTSSGAHLCWDMRFQLPITALHHPTNARVRRLLTNPQEHSSIFSAVQGNNEVSLWDMETNARQKTLWASSAPALSLTQASGHSVNGMHLGVTDSNTFLLTAGSDMRIRYWDLSSYGNSGIVVGAATDPTNQTVVNYRSRMVEGTEVIQETYARARTTPNEDIPRRGPDAPPYGHHDIITDINVCQTNQMFVITCSRDGVVKVWK